MAIFITAHMRRSSQESITFKDADGVNVSVLSADRVRVKIGRAGQTPLLEITSGTSHSTVTNANPAILKLHQDDLIEDNIKPGVYDVEISVVDSAEANKTKHAESGVFSLQDTPGGAIGTF